MRPIHILLVEDNEGDIFMTIEALEERRIINKISVVYDGKAAIDFLEQKGIYNKVSLPDLILLDINLPKLNGHEVLKYIKCNEKLKHIPVIILTTSSSERDINQSYQHHANCFITKPVEADNFLKVVSGIENYWVSIVTLIDDDKENISLN
ncbi:MAG: response regulator [Chitinophagaceae bacterium]|uniref:response regulator n=1 Tax=Microcystis sp. M57BS1 TaxID=2771200 RepID=UPI0025828F9E|nr:response regulator [Microcystis sp. M57BS1]MCA2536322.1 response regulator [Microcystis sp. M57BS1]MCA6438817.1 response regulator [Chitinophagaceae bacterium]MCA6455267.1 response regulator [Chitinophagaceae bacterium]